MKKIFFASQILLAINLFILIVPPAVFLIAFKLFPSINPTENGFGAYPLLFIVCGIAGLFVTIPFSAIMIVGLVMLIFSPIIIGLVVGILWSILAMLSTRW